MTTLRRLTYDSGKLAIYDVDSAAIDDNPLTTPLSYISRLQYHSDLECPSIIQKLTGTITLPTLAADTLYTHTYTIGAHGVAGYPYVEGKVQINGVWFPLAGSTVVQQCSVPTVAFASAFCRMISLGADTTNILIEEYSISSFSGGYGATLAIPYEIYLLDVVL